MKGGYAVSCWADEPLGIVNLEAMACEAAVAATATGGDRRADSGSL